MVFKSLHVFVDTDVLVRIVYSITLHHRLGKPKPLILSFLESGKLVLYIDNAVINELKSKALPRLLTRVNRAGHGWGDIGINVMEQYYIDELNHMLNEGYVRIIEDDKALEVQRRALKNRPTRRVCWKDEVMDQLLDKIPSEDIDVVNSLLYAYDLLATVPRRGRSWYNDW